MSKTKLVIFDLDGTLLDTIGDLAASCNHTLEQFGHPTHPIEAYPMFVGNGIAKLVERSLPSECRTAEYVERVRVEFVNYYKKHIADFSHPYDGVPELLNQLEEKGVQLAVASNKFHEGTLLLIDRFFGCERFAAVYGQRAGVPIKPDPTIRNATAGAITQSLTPAADLISMYSSMSSNIYKSSDSLSSISVMSINFIAVGFHFDMFVRQMTSGQVYLKTRRTEADMVNVTVDIYPRDRARDL
jgi:phosphoglycolate phosphatase-like HAD superfamily hydrolase